MSLRFERFELRAFGPFTATTLELRGAPGGDLHIICGPNEAGKSTAQRAIGDFLFGISPRSTDNQIHDYAQLRLAAVVVDEHGRRHQLVRRKGARLTLLDSGGEPIQEDLLGGLLGGITREVFESMFSITHDSLVVGGKALLAADGNLGESLFSASLGASGLHELRAELERAAGALFRPRSTSSLVLRARANLETAKDELRGSTLRATAFAEHERELEAARAQREELVAQIRRARTEQSARDRLRRVIPLLAAREQAREELESLAGAPELPEDARDRRLRAVERAAADRQSAEGAKARVDHLTAWIDELSPDPALLERELAIKDLHGRLANVREGAGDLERQRVKLETARGLAARALDQVRPDLDLQSAEQLLLNDPQRARVDGALDRHAQLTALLEDAEQATKDAELQARELACDLDARDSPPDLAALEGALGDAQATGQIEQRIAEAGAELGDSIDLLSAALRDLDPRAEVAALREMHPPSAAAVERFAQERERLDDRAGELADRRRQLDSESRDLDEERSRVALAADVPTVEDLVTAREERDQEWERLRRTLGGVRDMSASPDVFEGRLRYADDVADRLRNEADSVARHTQLTIRERRLDAGCGDLAKRERQLAEDGGEHERRWAAAWASTTLTPASPREMAEWLRVRRAIIERADAVARRSRRLEEEQRTRDGQLEGLRALVGARSEHTASLPPTLSGLVLVAQARVAEAQAAREEHDQLLRDLRSARATAATQREKAGALRSALERWHEEWIGIVAANAWPPGVDPKGARRMLATVADLATQLYEAAQLGARVKGIEERLDAFGVEAGNLIDAVAPDLHGRPQQDAVAELQRRLDGAIQNRSSRTTLAGERGSARDDLQRAQRSVEQAERELECLVELARVEAIDELPDAERRSSRAAVLRAQLPALECEITEAGQAPLRELLDRAHGVELDALDAQSSEGEERLAVLEEQLRQLTERIGELGREQQEMEHLGGAAGAAEHVERCVAELREHAERYVCLDLAAWALSEAIDAYRRQHKAPLLARADELFPRLTCRRSASAAGSPTSFRGLEVHFGADDEPALEGVRASGEKVPVKLMSTGTREQLYLALRLASLERHVELHGPMPVILDDVVLHSDPRRKSAILGALADLGRRTQVIAFTHDPQVVALAQNAIDPDLLTVHELGGNEISGALEAQIATADVRPIRPARAA